MMFSHTERMWLAASILVFVLSLFIIIKYKSFAYKHVIPAVILGLLAGIINPPAGVVTVAGYLAAQMIFSERSSKIVMVRSFSLRQLFLSIGLGLSAGGILGGINIWMAMTGGMEPVSASVIPAFIAAFNPGIYEEVSFRFFVYAFCLFLINQMRTRTEKLICLGIISVPHVLLHLPDVLLEQGVGAFFQSFIFLLLLFGLPLAILQLKRDLLSAMTAHYVIVLLRFIVFGVG
ncbi:MAG: CPBP family intramembrane metalloprotease [Alkalicoccus sp.]|nr:MAG: CPBP family intramembrane metalloprotease [Alkalicoccus sp.]